MKISVVVFSFSVLLWIQGVVGRDIQTQVLNTSGAKPAVGGGTTTNSVKELASSLAELDLSPQQVDRLNEEIRDAMQSGELDDMTTVPLSPQQEENVFNTVLISTFMKMADEGLIDPQVAKDKLYPQGAVRHPEVESAFNQIIQRAKTSTEKKPDAVKDRN
ncbi:hypothetical protein V6N13_121649 [Hibiscus sabdariffa]|uniref:Secreted protein n=1 Tax=Hibiscus sabdariffa TaxID=183260 RepID=A0ABR2PD42_9ROSI